MVCYNRKFDEAITATQTTHNRAMSIVKILGLKFLIFMLLLLGLRAEASNVFAKGFPLQPCETKNLISSPKGNQFTDMPSLPTFTRGRLAIFEQLLVGELPSAEITNAIVKLGHKRLPGVLKNLEDLGLLSEINRVAKLYQIDPVTILGPIVTESIFNGFLDRALQTSLASFDLGDLEQQSLIRYQLSLLPEVKSCLKNSTSNYWKSKCIEYFVETNVDRKSVRHKRGTYGIAQFNPALVWMLNDVVVLKTGEQAMNFWDLKEAYAVVLDQKRILHYIAAYNKYVIQLYSDLTCVDMSRNPGLVSSVYNLGNEYDRAYQTGQARGYPRENYFGWFINQNEPLMRQALNKTR